MEESILLEWSDLDWPNGIGIEYDEAAEYAEKVLGKGPVEIDFDEDAFYEVLNELEEEIAKRKGEDTPMDW